MTEATIFILALAGFWVARHIRQHKKAEVPLVCPIGFDCHAVVHSDYSKFMGMPVELLGMFYYGAVSLIYFLSFIFKLPLGVWMMLISLVAFLFSVYLVSVQAFVIKNWCSWCLVSAVISVLIFILTVL